MLSLAKRVFTKMLSQEFVVIFVCLEVRYLKFQMSPRKVSVKEDRDGAERASEAHGLTRPCLEFAPRTQV